MALLKRSTPSELPESQVEYRDTNSAKRWLMLLLYFIVALAIAVLVVLAGRWVYHKVHHASNPKPAPVTPRGANQGKAPAGGSSNNSSNNKSATNKSGSSNSNKPAGTSSRGTKSSPSPGALPNNGPGDVIALFVGSSLAAAGLHYIVTLRRAQKV